MLPGMLAAHADAIAAAYRLGRPSAEMVVAGRGELGRVWRLYTSEGSFAVKELLVRQLPADATLDVAYQDAVLATGSVTMPRAVRTGSGDVVSDLGGYQLRVYEWVDLLPIDRTLDAGLVGSTLAAVHRVRHSPARPLTSWYTDAVGTARWADLVDAAIAARAPFAEAFRHEVEFLIGLEGLIEAPRNLQNCHRDLWADNLLPTTGGELCVLDWENCGLEDPAQEIPMVLLEFAGGDAHRTAAVYAAYVDAGGRGRLDRRGAFTMVIAQFGHLLAKSAAAYLAPAATADDRAHSLERIAESLGTPLRVEHIDAVLDWVSPIR
jgi:Ser/Thr protein kinase RdoA (MazF antagonist)